MFKTIKILAVLSVFALTAFSNIYSGTVIYVHGFAFDGLNSNGSPNLHGLDSEYWPAGYAKRQNIVKVGYDGYASPYSWGSGGTGKLYAALNQHCRADQRKTCRLVVHSMGGLVSAYIANRYGSRFGITSVTALSSAEGGSKLGNAGTTWLLQKIGRLFGVRMIDSDAIWALKTSAARSHFNHNATNNINFYMVAGNRKSGGTDKSRALLYKALTPWGVKGHDQVVGFHSTCGYSGNHKGLSRCNGQRIRTDRRLRCTWRWFKSRCRWENEYTNFSRYQGRVLNSRLNNGAYFNHTDIRSAVRYMCPTPSSYRDGCR